MTKARTLAFALFLLALSAAQAAPPGPTVTFEPQRVVAKGITPGSRVMFFAVGLDPQGYESNVVRWAQAVTDDARLGTAALELGRKVPWKSIWVVVDLTNNQYTVASPAGFPARPAPLSPGLLRKSASGDVDRLAVERSFADALYVAPGGGAWTIEARDGHDTDGDGAADGTTTVALQRMQPVESAGGKASRITPGGLLFVLDFSRMDVLAIRVNEQLLRGAR